MYELLKNTRPDRIKLFTISTNNDHPNLRLWTDTAKYWGWDYDLFITEVKSTKQFGAMIYKIELLKHVLHNMDDVDYVAIVDAYDVIINNTPEECIHRIHKDNLKHMLIIGKDGVNIPFINKVRYHNSFFNRSNDCNMDYNLGVVIGSTNVIRVYIERMLYVWENDNLCTKKFCSEQMHFQKLANFYNLYECSNKTLYIDINHYFVYTDQSNLINILMPSESNTKHPIFIHVHGNKHKYEQTLMLYHYYNKVLNLSCSKGCFKCYPKQIISNLTILQVEKTFIFIITIFIMLLYTIYQSINNN